MAKSPYVQYERRLQDVMAAIQIMGTYRWSEQPMEHWQDILGADPLSKDCSWQDVFDQHPEFFQTEPSKKYGKKTGLRWRRAYERIFDPNRLKEIIDEEERKRLGDGLSRPPLTPEQIGTLLSTAIELDARERAFVEGKRWWVSSVVGLLGVIIGAILAAILA